MPFDSFRKEREARERREQEAQAAYEREAQQAAQGEAQSAAMTRRLESYAKSVSQASGLEYLINELTTATGQHFSRKDNPGPHKYSICFEWDHDGNGRGSCKFIWIDIDLEGTITIRREWSNNGVSISRQEWLSNRHRRKLEDALEEAYRHPCFYRKPSSSTTTFYDR